MKRKEILEQTIKTVCSDREGQYGSPENNFEIIKDLWQTYLSTVIEKKDGFIDSVDVAIMMALLKIARIATGKHKDDNYIDLAGYAACAAELGSCEGEGERDERCESFEVTLYKNRESDSEPDPVTASDRAYIVQLSTTISNLTEELLITKEKLKTASVDMAELVRESTDLKQSYDGLKRKYTKLRTEYDRLEQRKTKEQKVR